MAKHHPNDHYFFTNLKCKVIPSIFNSTTLFVSTILVSILFAFTYRVEDSQLISFPEAEGWGKYSVGGRGGKIIEVTNLNDSGPGSLRSAIDQSGARIIVFKVSGNISLDTILTIQNDSITIAGQTAPGDGICIKNFPLEVRANEVIIRYLRFRHGDEHKNEDDAINILFSKNVIVDHCSASWGIDETLSCWGTENVTVQWCIISESLNNSYHHKGPHGYGSILGGKNSSFHHNLYAHHSSRNPRFSGGTTSPCINVDFRNNVIYNWGFNSSYGGENGKINIVRNYYKSGPATLENVKERIINPWDSTGRWYVSENFVVSSPAISDDNWNGGVQDTHYQLDNIRVLEPFEFMPIKQDLSEAVLDKILIHGGASLPKRDIIDYRILQEVKKGTASFGSSWYNEEYKLPPNKLNGIIDSQTDVGGWPELKSLPPPEDSDHDGMPDEWELKYGLNPNNYNDRIKISSSGYSYIEEYLNSLGKF